MVADHGGAVMHWLILTVYVLGAVVSLAILRRKARAQLRRLPDEFAGLVLLIVIAVWPLATVVDLLRWLLAKLGRFGQGVPR